MHAERTSQSGKEQMSFLVDKMINYLDSKGVHEIPQKCASEHTTGKEQRRFLVEKKIIY